jgi:hypothetical protein
MLSPTIWGMSMTRFDVLNYCKNSWIACGSALDLLLKFAAHLRHSAQSCTEIATDEAVSLLVLQQLLKHLH